MYDITALWFGYVLTSQLQKCQKPSPALQGKKNKKEGSNRFDTYPCKMEVLKSMIQFSRL